MVAQHPGRPLSSFSSGWLQENCNNLLTYVAYVFQYAFLVVLIMILFFNCIMLAVYRCVGNYSHIRDDLSS